MAHGLKELEDAVCNVIQIIKQIPELERLRLAVVGGLALWHYLADHRKTDNINFITDVSTSPSLIKKKLLGHPKSPFREDKQTFLYRNPAGWDIQIEFCSQWRFPYLPRAARFVRELLYGEVPYISLADLIVFKLDSSWLAPPDVPEKSRDGHDAAALLENEIVQRAANPERAEPTSTLLCPAATKVTEPVVRLSPRQENFVRDAFCDMARCGSRDKSWWEDCLGLSRRPGLGRSHATSESNRPLGHFGVRGWTPDEPNSSWDDWDGYERLDGRAHINFRKRVNSMPQGPSWSPWNGPSTASNTPTPGQSTPAPTFCTVVWPTAPVNYHTGDASMRSSISLSPRSTVPRDDYFGPYAGLGTVPREEDSFDPHASLGTLPREDYFGPYPLTTPTTSMDVRTRIRFSRSDSGYSSTGDCVCSHCHPGSRYSSFSEGMPEMKFHFGAKLREKLLGTVAEVTSMDERDGDAYEELRGRSEEPSSAPIKKSVAFLA
ncbi:hypothetical protein F4861DRAFT_516220 [Xylaria intraflava]|nr:hypothetical protein F4861DRAFT_516220 [Xylaria intraflava]